MYPLFIQNFYHHKFWYFLLLLLCCTHIQSCGACNRKANKARNTLPSKKIQSLEVSLKKIHGYVVGGLGISGITDQVYKFDPDKLPDNPLEKMPDYPLEIQNACAFTLNGKAYVVGGLGISGITDQVYRFDADKLPGNPWEKMPDYPLEIQDACAFTLNGKAYVVGGWSFLKSFSSRTDQVYRFDADKLPGHPWEKMPDYPLEIQDAFSFTLNGKAYVVGGWSSLSITDQVYRFDADKLPDNPWEKIQDYPTEILDACAFTLQPDTP